MRSTAMMDLSTIPDEALKFEYMRRFNARRRRGGGRPQVLKPCPLCGLNYSAVEMRVHVPKCRKERSNDAGV